MSEKITEHISFCNRKADNIRSEDLKIEILNSLQEKYQIDISFKPYTLLKHTRLLPCVSKHPHLLSLRTVGNSYFLYLTNINGVNYCFYIDKKVDAPKHMYPRMLSVKYRFNEELFTGTLFDGELIHDADDRWYFILSDVLVYKNQVLNNQSIERRIELLYYIMQNDYTPDMVLDICPFQIRKVFTYNDIDYILNNYIPNLPYNTKGICFNTLNPQYSSYIYMFNQSERIYSKYKKQPQLEKTIVKKQTQETCVLKIVDTSTSQIYDLYCNNDGKLSKYGVAYVGDAAHRQFIKHLFDTSSDKLNVMVECYYVLRHHKWKPINKSTQVDPDERDKINKIVDNYKT